MAIVSTDILYKYSVKGTGGGNLSSGTAAGSLGEHISTTAITTGVLNNLFDDVSGAENQALDVEYRCIFVHNNHGSLTLQNAVVWVFSEVAGGANIAIALDDIVASPIGQVAVQADAITNEDTAPTNTGAFSTPTTKGTGLSIGNLQAGYCKAIWVRRTATNSSALANDGATLRIEGDTAA